MFFEDDRINVMREMIWLKTKQGGGQHFPSFCQMQRSDFVELFSIMHGLPVTIRLLDPPLHEFLPKTEEESQRLRAC